MAYTLTVTSIPGERAEFAFDTLEARLGRTADNDIVVKDPNASRAHCRVFVKDGRHWIEDLKSANGTTVNGELVQGTTVELTHGDTFAIGDVVFAFAVQLTPSTEIPASDISVRDTVVRGGYGRAAENSGAALLQTGLSQAFDPKEREPTPPNAKAPPKPKLPPPLPPPLPLNTEEVQKPAIAMPVAEEQQDATATIDTSDEPPPSLDSEPDPVTAPPEGLAKPAPLPAPVAQPAEADRVPVRRGRDLLPAEDSEMFEPTAAQKARIRRQANKTTSGRLLYAFGELKLPVRVAVVLLVVAFFGGLGTYAYVVLAPPPPRVLPSEPGELLNQGDPIEESFGTGEGVDYERPDLKSFTFKAVAPTTIVGLLHYQARGIAKDEVALSVNGADLGFVPPDGVNTEDRQLEVVVPANDIKRNEQNQLVFDNVLNPPGRDGWAIWNVSLQLFPLPETSAEEAPIAVKRDLELAQKFFDQRTIGPDSLFKAWKGYRDAWLKLESMPGRPNDLYVIARTGQAETWKLLDRRCKLMQVEVQRAIKKRIPDYDMARIVLKDMLRYFPTREHPCHDVVNAQLKELEQF